MTTTLFIVLKSKEKNYKESLSSWSAMHAFRVVIAVIEGPVGLTHRSHNVSSFEALIIGFHFSQNVYTALKYSFGPIKAPNY